MRAAWWWLDRWRKSSAYRDLTPEQKGMYRDLLDEVWLREGGVIPDDDRVLGLIVGDPERWKVLRESILSRFRRVKGGWTNDTAQEVMAQAKRRRDNQKAYRDRLQSNNKSDNGADNDGDHATDNTADNNPDSPSPSPSNVVPSLRSGGLLPTHTPSVKASVQAPESPLVEMVAAANPDAGWSRDACDAWAERFKGQPPGGQIGRALKPLVQKHGWGAVRPAWRTYLAFSQPEFASAARFAMTYGEWAARAGRPLPL
jgi:uncharacterized protein YdaU (DUF1376 family)